MRPEIDFAGREIQGTRQRQEDFYAFEELEEGGLVLVLADGVGGETHGDLASRAAVKGFLDSFAAAEGSDDLRFNAALKKANEEVARVIDDLPEDDAEVATTLVAVQVRNRELRWISVGDSPLLIYRGGELQRLNADHSGRAVDHPPGLARNSLVSALTGGRIAKVDHPAQPYGLESGDLLLTASDGLWSLTMEEIRDVLATHPEDETAQIASRLLAEIEGKKLPSQDNATLAVIRIA